MAVNRSFEATRADDEVAPLPAIRRKTIGRLKSIQSGLLRRLNSVLSDIGAREVAVSYCLTTSARRSVVIFAAMHGQSMQLASCFRSAFVLTNALI